MRLDSSDLKISRILLGLHELRHRLLRIGSQTLAGGEAAEPIFWQASDPGTTFGDTANVYGMGMSEETIGRAIGKLTDEEIALLEQPNTPRPSTYF